MSATTKKKHVTKEVLEEYPLPNEARQIVKVYLCILMRTEPLKGKLRYIEQYTFLPQPLQLYQETMTDAEVTASRGNNLHEVLTPSDEKFLVSMPSKFRKHVWIKRGDFIMMEPIEEGDKVKGEITHILFKDQIKHIQEQKMWPEPFRTKGTEENKSMVPNDMLPPSDSEDSDNGLGDLVINMNRAQVTYLLSESEEETTDEDEEDETDNICENDENIKPSSSVGDNEKDNLKRENRNTMNDKG